MMRGTPVLLCGLVLVLCVTAAAADVVTLTPSKDNTLYENATGALSNGKGASLFAVRTDDGELRRALVAFDIANAIQAGSHILSVDLAMTVSRVASDAPSAPFELRRVLADWGEGTSNSTIDGGGMGATATARDATWIHRFFPSTLWMNTGGDFESTASAVQTIGGVGTYHWGPTAAMVADVQGWLNDPANNFGWLLLGNEASTLTTRRFNSRENSDTAAVPKLTITFTRPAAVPVLSPWGLLLLVPVLMLVAVLRLRRGRSVRASG